MPLDGADRRSWLLPPDLGAFALDGRGHALVALRTGLFWLDLETEYLTLAVAARALFASMHRNAPDGRLDQVIELPVSQPTMCCFAGERLDELYITSAREKLGEEQLKVEPHCGGLFRLLPGISGQLKHQPVL